MLAFEPSVPVEPTIVSRVIAVALTGLGLLLALQRPNAVFRVTGGGVVGLAVAVMHYTGMSGMRLPGALSWDLPTVVASVVIGCFLSGCALPLALSSGRRRRRVAATGLLTASICALHFTGISAVTIILDGTATVPVSGISSQLLAMIVAVACLMLLLLGLAAVGLARRMARRQEAERTNLRDLADIAVEGLVVCQGETIVTVNTSFIQMIGMTTASLVGKPISTLFEAPLPVSLDVMESSIDLMLAAGNGEQIPVEVVRKPILYSGKPHQVIAVRDLRERRKVEQEMRFLAHNDSLTGLVNRVAFGHALDCQVREQSRHGEMFSLLALDLDRFKDVNDTLGHQIGDLLLKRVAGRLRAMVRGTDTIARLGGDEFAILATAPFAPADADILARRIVEVIRRPYILEGKVVNIGASIGVVLAPQDGQDPTTLLRNADIALYRAKQEGRNTMQFFEPSMDQKMQERRRLEIDLRRAITNDEIKVFYQPLLDVRRQEVCGFEALVRWQSPERGLVMPGVFIPLAEETGLIVPIGEHVLNVATKQAAEWGGDITVAVNLSAIQFASGNLVRTVTSALRRSGLPANRLELEITESVLLREGDDTLSTLHALRDLGIRISMDDFGTGYSSLRYLRSFPFDKIKIDRSFVNEMLASKESSAIIWAVLGLGQRLGITTIAEGVETEEQREYLEQEGCDVLQGYLIGRPVPAEEARRFVKTSALAAA